MGITRVLGEYSELYEVNSTAGSFRLRLRYIYVALLESLVYFHLARTNDFRYILIRE